MSSLARNACGMYDRRAPPGPQQLCGHSGAQYTEHTPGHFPCFFSELSPGFTADFVQQARGQVTIHLLLQIEGHIGDCIGGIIIGGIIIGCCIIPPQPACMGGIHGCCIGFITNLGGGAITLVGSSLVILNDPHTVAVPQPPSPPPWGGAWPPLPFPLRPPGGPPKPGRWPKPCCPGGGCIWP